MMTLLTKPFSTEELLARIRALLRRRAPETHDTVVEFAGLRLDPASRSVSIQHAFNGARIEVGPTEFRLLHLLLSHPGRVFWSLLCASCC